MFASIICTFRRWACFLPLSRLISYSLQGAFALPSAAVVWIRGEGRAVTENHNVLAALEALCRFPLRAPTSLRLGPFAPRHGERKGSQVTCPEPQLTSGQREGRALRAVDSKAHRHVTMLGFSPGHEGSFVFCVTSSA